MKRIVYIVLICCLFTVSCNNNEPVEIREPVSGGDCGGDSQSKSSSNGGQSEESIKPQILSVSGNEDIPDDVPAHLYFGGLGGGPGIPFECLEVDDLENDVQIDQYPSGIVTKRFCYCINKDPGSKHVEAILTRPDQSSKTLDGIVTKYTDVDYCAEFEYAFGSSLEMDTHTVELTLGGHDISQRFMPVPGYLFYGFRANEPIRLILFTPWGTDFIAERYVNADGQGNLFFELSNNSSWASSGGSIDKDEDDNYPIVFAIGQSSSCKMVNPENMVNPGMVENCKIGFDNDGDFVYWDNQTYDRGEPIAPANQGEWAPCENTYPSRLHVGDDAYVAYDPPYKNNVRSKAEKDSNQVGQISPGEEFLVLDGPKCANGWVWWKISSYSQNLKGWTAEGDNKDYWLVPND